MFVAGPQKAGLQRQRVLEPACTSVSVAVVQGKGLSSGVSADQALQL